MNNETVSHQNLLAGNFAKSMTSEGNPQEGGGGGYPHTLPIRVCAAQRGSDFEAPDLEWDIHFRGVVKNGI